MKTFNRILFVVLFLTAGAAAIFAIIQGNIPLAWVISMCIVCYSVWLAFTIILDKLEMLSMSNPLLLGVLVGRTIKDLREEHKYTQADLVKFGKYLLSEQREQSIENKENLRGVHDCDIANFKK